MAASPGKRPISPTSCAAISPERQTRTLYGRRKGKPLRAGQARLLGDLLPRLSVPAEGPIEPLRLFGTSIRAVRLEIGFGGGEHLLRHALAAPDIGLIGCEPFVNGVAKLLAQVEQHAISNVRVHAGDAREVLSRLPAECLDRVDLLYPDPWPKRRQRKRRFVSPETLSQIAASLKPGAALRFASDIDDYTGWTLAHVLAGHEFRWDGHGASDWRQPWADWQPTRYEEKARREGRDSAYLTLTRA